MFRLPFAETIFLLVLRGVYHYCTYVVSPSGGKTQKEASLSKTLAHSPRKSAPGKSEAEFAERPREREKRAKSFWDALVLTLNPISAVAKLFGVSLFWFCSFLGRLQETKVLVQPYQGL